MYMGIAYAHEPANSPGITRALENGLLKKTGRVIGSCPDGKRAVSGKRRRGIFYALFIPVKHKHR